MSAPARRRLTYAAVGAVATLVVIAVALFLLKQGLDTSSKVAGIIGLFLSIAMAIWTVRQARRARQEEAVPGTSTASQAASPSGGPNAATNAASAAQHLGSRFDNVSVNGAGKVVMGDHNVSTDHFVFGPPESSQEEESRKQK